MLFCHIVDDYYLQGILASMKQKKWWQENAPDKLYEYDYLIALLMHGFSWAFMIMLPIAYWVKIADMKDHLIQTATLTDKLKEKYLRGLAILL